MSKDIIKSPIAKEGYPFIAIGFTLTVIMMAFSDIGMASLLALSFTFFVVWFFRNPERSAPEGENLIISPADGKIIGVDLVDESRYLNRRVLRICVFMSVFNVHVNRIPFNGTIKGIFYNKGLFLSAFKEKASMDNEQNAILMETKNGVPILFVQIAGLIARRIVCYLSIDDNVNQGDRFGLIRFGSRVDIYLPVDSKPAVKKGEYVSAGKTVLAHLVESVEDGTPSNGNLREELSEVPVT